MESAVRVNKMPTVTPWPEICALFPTADVVESGPEMRGTPIII